MSETGSTDFVECPVRLQAEASGDDFLLDLGGAAEDQLEAAKPDSVAGIRQIKRGFIVGPLSNGTTALLVDMAKAAGLPWDVILGSDISRAYKPSPDACCKPAALLGLDPGEVMLAAAHNSDMDGARRAGLATAFIARPIEYGPHQASDLTASGDWDLTATSITDLARQPPDNPPSDERRAR
jgi:2-haloacid dehalogenase